MYKNLLIALAILLLSTPVLSEENKLLFEIKVELENGKIIVSGETNLPKNTKLGIKIINKNELTVSKSYDIYTDDSGGFLSSEFSYYEGKKFPNDEYTIRAVFYNNKIWQDDKSTREKIQKLGVKEGFDNDGYEKDIPLLIEDSWNKHSIKISESDKNKIYSFCFAMQASMLCKNLKMRFDTEKRLEKELGGLDFRKPYSSSCTDGIMDVPDDITDSFCQEVWEKYGCDGTEVARLVQENPFTLENPVTCQY